MSLALLPACLALIHTSEISYVYQNTVTVDFFELKINQGLRKVPGYKSKDFFLSPTGFG